MEKGVLLKKKKYPEGALMTKSQFFLSVPLPEWSWIISFLSGNPFYRNGVSVVMVMVHVKESSANQVLHYKIVTAYLTFMSVTSFSNICGWWFRYVAKLLLHTSDAIFVLEKEKILDISNLSFISTFI